MPSLRPFRISRQHMRRLVKLAVATAGALAAFSSARPQAHKAITSKYTYNADVFPIFRDRCGGCHVGGGASPMSLLSYKDAVPWAESIREELMAERMPPWYVDEESAPIKGGPSLPAREIDAIVTWATGGTPEGDPTKRPTPPGARNEWRAGRPDLIVSMDTAYTMPAGTQEETREFTLSTGLREARYLKAADLLPGTPSIVRDATISIEKGQVLAVWVPSDEAGPAPDGMAFRLPAGVNLQLRIHYKKSWQDEGVSKSDRSAIGLYFADPPAPGRELREMTVEHERDVADPVTIAAICPTLDRPYATIDVHAQLPSGARVPLLRLRSPRPEWRRRYWLAPPVELPRGSRIEITATAAAPDSDAAISDAGASPHGAAAQSRPSALAAVLLFCSSDNRSDGR